MATYEAIKSVNLYVGEDLSGSLFQAVKIDANGRAVKATAATDVIVGYIGSDPGRTLVAGKDVINVVMVGAGGIGKCVTAGAVTAGELVVASTTAGKVSTVADIAALSANQMAVGIALESAAGADSIIQVLNQTISGPTA